MTVSSVDDLRARIREVPDFPKPGILFYDITTLLKDGAAFAAVIDRMADAVKDDRVDVVVGMESRGFIFAAPIAYKLGAGFVPVRKLGKLPAETIEVEYDLEYGTATLEIHRDAIQAGQRAQLVDDLLAFSRMGRAEMRQSRVDLQSLVQEVRRELMADSGGRSIEWRIGELPQVEADPSLLRQVFRNLLGNALKYTRPRPHTLIEVGSREEGGEVEVWVRDNGVGFEMQYVDKLFGVFQRLHTIEQFEGTGIGLANVRRIISRHGGRTWAEGAVGQGATFHFTLPRAPARDAAS